MYLAPEALADYIGLNDLAIIVGGRVNADIDAEVLLTALKGESLDKYLVYLVNDVEVAMVRINLALSSAQKLVNAYVSARYDEALTAEEIADSPLPAMVATMVKHDLMLNTDDDTKAEYKAALEQLKMIANGKLNLGANDPAASKSASIATGRSGSNFDFARFGR